MLNALNPMDPGTFFDPKKLIEIVAVNPGNQGVGTAMFSEGARLAGIRDGG
jgi:hypothetical protein